MSIVVISSINYVVNTILPVPNVIWDLQMFKIIWGGGIFLIVQSDKDRKLVLHCNLSVKLFSANQGN